MFPVYNRKSEQHHLILQIQISLSTKFQLKLKFLTFWTKFSQKGRFRSKTENVNNAIEFSILELVSVVNFSLNWQFWFFFFFFLTKFAQKGQIENWKIVLARASMVVTYYIKLFRTGPTHNGIFMSLLLLVAETNTCHQIPINFMYRSSHRWCSLNKNFLKTSQYLQENICAGVSF